MSKATCDAFCSKLAVALAIVIGITTSCFASDDFIVEADPGNRLKISRDGRAFCEYDSKLDAIRLSPTSLERATRLRWLVRVPGELRHFAVNDEVDFAYFATTDGLYSCSLTSGDTLPIAAAACALPASFKVELLQIQTVATNVALVLSHDTLALFSPFGNKVLHKVGKSYQVHATSSSRVMMYAPGSESDLQMLIVSGDLSRTFRGTRITTFGQGAPFPLLRLLETNTGGKDYVGIVSYSNSPGHAVGDALMVWKNGTVLDVDRSESFSDCLAIALYSQTVCALFSKSVDSQDTTARIVNWQLSMSKGLLRMDDINIVLGEVDTGILRMHPAEPAVLNLSSDATRLRICGFASQLAADDQVGKRDSVSTQ